MPDLWLWITILAAVALLIAGFWRPARGAAREAMFVRARRSFHLRREWLEAHFIRLAAKRSPSKAVRWGECEFDDNVAYVRNRSSGELSAFVEVIVPVDEPFGSASGLDALGNHRIGTAIFRFDRNHWDTEGRAILNLNPSEAIRYYHEDLEVVDREPARQP